MRYLPSTLSVILRVALPTLFDSFNVYSPASVRTTLPILHVVMFLIV